MNRLVAVCTGHRCAALLEHSCGQALPLLRTAVRASPDVVLMSTGCVGACAQAPVVALSEGVPGPVAAASMNEPAAGTTRPAARRTTWLGPVGPAEVDGLCAWVGDPRQHTAPLSLPLRSVVFHPAAG